MNIKICGLKDAKGVEAAVNAGARYIGLNFFEKSPRYVDIATAKTLALHAGDRVEKVALAVNPTDAFLDELTKNVSLDMLQLHGSESPERVADVRLRYGLPVMKAIGVADEDDLTALKDYEQVADLILVDAKPPKNAVLPGGNGLSFDWRLIAGRQWQRPWMLAGGLTPENVAEAIALTGAQQVDVSSGVEIAPGVKDAALIKAFVEAACVVG